MPLMIYDGKLLIVDGKLAVNADCCCGGGFGDCTVCQEWSTARDRYYVTFTNIQEGTCGNCNAIFNTTHTLTRVAECEWEKEINACGIAKIHLRFEFDHLGQYSAIISLLDDTDNILATYLMAYQATKLECASFDRTSQVAPGSSWDECYAEFGLIISTCRLFAGAFDGAFAPAFQIN